MRFPPLTTRLTAPAPIALSARWIESPEWTRICVGLDYENETRHAAAKEILTSV